MTVTTRGTNRSPKARTALSIIVHACNVALVAFMFAFSIAWLAPANAASVTETFSAHTAGSTKIVDHSAWTRLLQQYTVASPDGINRVDYRAFKADNHSALKSYLSALAAVKPSTLDRPEQFAFWANLYNAKTVDVILENYPVKTIRDITIGGGFFDALKKTVGAGGPWKAKILTIAGTKLSLDDIEHQIMRKVFDRPWRVHYAVNCASYGCPNLRREAFTGANLDTALDAGARDYINHPRGIDVNSGSATASSIYSWFKKDFGATEMGVLDHIRKFAADDLRAKLKGITTISGYDYDWTLNDIQR